MTSYVMPTAEQIEAAVELGKEKYAAALDAGTAHGPQNDWITAEVLAILPGKTEAAAKAEALTKAADAWQRGQWADAPRRADRVQERIANGQHVTHWLRARAATHRAEAAS